MFLSPEVYTEPERFALTELCERVFIDSLNEYSYAADLAGLDYDLMAVRHGLKVSSTVFFCFVWDHANIVTNAETGCPRRYYKVL